MDDGTLYSPDILPSRFNEPNRFFNFLKQHISISLDISFIDSSELFNISIIRKLKTLSKLDKILIMNAGSEFELKI